MTIGPGTHYTRADDHLRGTAGTIDPIALDLLDLASAAYVTDRQTRRGHPDSARWSRNLDFTVAVRRPEVLTDPEVRSAILNLLSWLTDDVWRYKIERLRPEAEDVQLSLPFDAASRDVALFSGGLDSTAGVALLLNGGASVLGAAVATNGRMRGYQSSVADALSHVPGWDLEVRSSRWSVVHEHAGDERTRRSRGLVFLVAGWAMAVAAQRRRLLVLENGIGAINLGYTAAQTGCMTSRGAHPQTLTLASNVFSLVNDEPFEVVNPHLSQTKAQMVGQLPEAARAACELSESCDVAASARGRLQSRCGSCSSCLLRRMSLRACGRPDWDGRPYLADSKAPGDASMLPEMLWQVGQLARALAPPEPFAALQREFPQLLDLPVDALSPTAAVDLYKSYVREWTRDPHPLVRQFLPAPEVAA